MYIEFWLLAIAIIVFAFYIYSIKAEGQRQQAQLVFERQRLYRTVYNLAHSHLEEYANAKKTSKKAIAERTARTILFVLYPGDGHDEWLEDISEIGIIFQDFVPMPQTDMKRQADRDKLYKTELVQDDLSSYLIAVWDQELNGLEA